MAFRYEIWEVVGKGTYSTAYIAYDHKTRKIVVMKSFRQDARSVQVQQNERHVLNILNARDACDKKNIVWILDHVSYRGLTYFVYEALYQDLRMMLQVKPDQGLYESTYSRIAIQILIALQFLWANDVVHGDLKPANVLLKERGKTGIKLIDFGGAHHPDWDSDGMIITTLGYTAPEVILNLGWTPASDMWSFGVILFELKYGRMLFPCVSER